VDLLASQTKLTVRGKDPAAINRTLDRLAHAEKADATVADPTAQSDSAGTWWGIFDPKNPLNSALLLAGNGIDQGLLRAGDLYRLRLNNDLITLTFQLRPPITD
jgi:hypothetical protein